MKWILFLSIISSCAVAKKNVSKAHEEQTLILPEPKVIEVFNGKVKYVTFDLIASDKLDYIECHSIGAEKDSVVKMPFSRFGEKAQLYYGESYHSTSKKHHCFLGKRQVLEVQVKQFPYKQEFLKVARGKVVLSKKNKERAAREWHMTQKLYKNSLKTSLVRESFRPPLSSYITSRYGKRRIFNKVKKTQHLGNDFRAAVGVPIPVANRGKVVFAGNLFYTGNVVIVDHGLNLFTLYAHLSKIKSEVGTIVDKGDVVGLAGATGRVSGPHLHWGVKLHGFDIDGFSLVSESKEQFKSNAIPQ